MFSRMAAYALLAALLNAPAAPPSGRSFVNGTQHEGESLTCELPADEQVRNRGSQVDGRGLCVACSIEMAARWQGMADWHGLSTWCAREPGGAWPEKVDRQLAAFAREHHLPPPGYLHYRGRDPRPLLEAVDRTGRMACVTYGFSPRYGGPIAHMVCCVKFNGQWAAVLDNNFPDPKAYEWLSLDELVRRVKYPTGSAWVFVWLTPPPPPVPHNGGAKP